VVVYSETMSVALTPAAFAAVLAPLWPKGAGAAAVAVSGGADSLALTLLMRDWAAAHGVALTALTVDHGLRPESTAEARQVGAWLAARGISHQVLAWDGDKPTANIQATARQARYDLLTSWCRARGAPVLLLGHHADDQIETFLLRLGRGSGLRGLSAMRAIEKRNDIMVLRPFLATPKQALLETLRTCGQPWLDDPSNFDMRFRRSHVRALAAQLPAGPAQSPAGGSGARRIGRSKARRSL
jgi:tRNA(Ile)-lysidine synthase